MFASPSAHSAGKKSFYNANIPINSDSYPIFSTFLYSPTTQLTKNHPLHPHLIAIIPTFAGLIANIRTFTLP